MRASNLTLPYRARYEDDWGRIAFQAQKVFRSLGNRQRVVKMKTCDEVRVCSDLGVVIIFIVQSVSVEIYENRDRSRKSTKFGIISLRAYTTSLEGVPRDPSIRGATALKLENNNKQPLKFTEPHILVFSASFSLAWVPCGQIDLTN